LSCLVVTAAGLRTKAVTTCPWSRPWARISRPVPPVAPKTRSFMARCTSASWPVCLSSWRFLVRFYPCLISVFHGQSRVSISFSGKRRQRPLVPVSVAVEAVLPAERVQPRQVRHRLDCQVPAQLAQADRAEVHGPGVPLRLVVAAVHQALKGD